MLNIFKGLVSDLELAVADVQADHQQRMAAPSRRGKRSKSQPKTALITQALAGKAVDDVERGTFVAASELVKR